MNLATKHVCYLIADDDGPIPNGYPLPHPFETRAEALEALRSLTAHPGRYAGAPYVAKGTCEVSRYGTLLGVALD